LVFLTTPFGWSCEIKTTLDALPETKKDLALMVLKREKNLFFQNYFPKAIFWTFTEEKNKGTFIFVLLKVKIFLKNIYHKT
jgi:hypothetical protein